MGAYADTDRFDPPAANESLSTAMSYITYDPAADDPFDNTVRLLYNCPSYEKQYSPTELPPCRI